VKPTDTCRRDLCDKTGNPLDRARDENDVIEYMITKEFFLDCTTNVRPDPGGETKPQLTSRLKFCADYAKTHAKAAADKERGQ
jgi:hypothetical protein